MAQQRALSHAGPSFGFPPGQVFVSAEASEEAALLQVCGIEITGRRAIPSLLSSRTLDLARACSVGAAGSSPETSGRPGLQAATGHQAWQPWPPVTSQRLRTKCQRWSSSGCSRLAWGTSWHLVTSIAL